MTVAEAIEVVRRAGTVELSHGNLKLRFPEIARTRLQPAIDVLRRGKAKAVALLTSECGGGPTGMGLEPEGLSELARRENVLHLQPPRLCAVPLTGYACAKAAALPSKFRGHTVELWRAEERFFFVVDEEDARLVMAQQGVGRGEVWTATEVELVVRIEDQPAREEIQRFKRELDGRVVETRVKPRPKGREWAS